MKTAQSNLTRSVPQRHRLHRLVVALAGLLAAGCSGEPGAGTDGPDSPNGPNGTNGTKRSNGFDHDKPTITNRIEVPPLVRRNLGITFARVERRHVASTVRVPGRFELKPRARREYHTPLSGRVELLVDQYARVESGAPLYRVDSPQWRTMQHELDQTMIRIRQAARDLSGIRARDVAVERHDTRLREQAKVWSARVEQVEALVRAGGGAASELADARARLAETMTLLAEVKEEHALLNQQRINVKAKLDSYRRSTPLLYADALGERVSDSDDRPPRPDLSMTAAAATLGLSIEALRRNVGTDSEPLPYWRTIDQVAFTAQQAGVIESLDITNGAWVDTAQRVITTADPTDIRFRAVGLQSDLGRLRPGMRVRIVPPRGGGAALTGSIEGRLTIGLEADPVERKIDLIVIPQRGEPPPWARQGVAAELEIVLDETDEPQLAVPAGAVIRDGLRKILFRRDPKDPDQVIRLEADLGVGDGRWVVIESGLTDGNEVVHHGVYELMLAGGSGRQQGGHFHADGTFHEEEHE
ncbi:MAG: hypothetical protein CMJ18_16405 [Phycisphaeraceae bacterium]|nr:hypothetical protein [Phycisphaeraceae bacterium]